MSTPTPTPTPSSISVRGYLGDLYATALVWNRYFQWALAFAGVVIVGQQIHIYRQAERLAHRDVVYIRVDDLGRHDVLDPGQITAPHPKEHEIRTDLGAFAVKYYSRLRGVVTRDFHDAEYFLAPALQREARDTIRKDLTDLAKAGADEINIEIRDVKITQMDQLPYRAEVPLEKQYLQPGTKRLTKPSEMFTLMLTFEFADTKAWTIDYLQVNPRGIVVTSQRLQPVFKSEQTEVSSTARKGTPY